MSVVAQEPLEPAAFMFDARTVHNASPDERGDAAQPLTTDIADAPSTGLDGGALLGVMVLGMLLVLATVWALTKHQTYWVMGGAFLILVALLAAGVAWMLSVLSEEETWSAAESDEAATCGASPRIISRSATRSAAA